MIITNNGALTNIDGLANLTSVEFRLDIADNIALTNIDGLANFILTDAHLNIINNDALTNLDGLAHLVSGGLTIDDNDALTNLNSLTNLTSVNTLFISDNDALTNIDGLANLTSVADYLRVTGNAALTNLDGLANLTSVGHLRISSNAALTNLDGLANLTSVGLSLAIDSNAALTNLDGLANLTSVGFILQINSNAALTNLDGLANLTSFGYILQINSNAALTNVDGLSGVTSVGFDLDVQSNDILLQCVGLSQLIDQWDDAESGPGPGTGGVPDVGGEVLLGDNLTGCNSIQEILANVNPSRINAGLNDAWYNPETDGQGFFITVFPDLNAVSLAWFTYDTGLPAEDATANLGDPGHRWLTAIGPIEGNQAIMQIEMTSGGIFDAATLIDRTDPPGSDGTILLTFTSCNSGTVEYDIPSINRQGTVPIQRVAGDNIALCEALSSN